MFVQKIHNYYVFFLAMKFTPTSTPSAFLKYVEDAKNDSNSEITENFDIEIKLAVTGSSQLSLDNTFVNNIIAQAKKFIKNKVTAAMYKHPEAFAKSGEE